jgi:hypothetical protein
VNSDCQLRQRRVNHMNWSAAHGRLSVLALSDQPMISTAHRQEFGLLRNRPDASLLLRARWIAQTRRRLGTANDRRNHHGLSSRKDDAGNSARN